MKYKLIIPSGHPEMTFGTPQGSVTMQNGAIVNDSQIVRSYPQYFTKVADNTPKPPKVEVKAPVVKEEITVPVEDAPAAPTAAAPVVAEKKKPGRPKGSLKKG
jgi:hypothetical protein